MKSLVSPADPLPLALKEKAPLRAPSRAERRPANGWAGASHGPIQAKPAISTGYEDLVQASQVPPTRARTEDGLPPQTRSKMEQALGQDFSDVRVHRDSPRATELRSLAFTQGSDIHFAPGQWAPETERGQRLLGHELGHVMQQRSGRVGATAQMKGAQVNDEPALEREADALAARAVTGASRTEPAPGTPAGSATPLIQRQCDCGGTCTECAGRAKKSSVAQRQAAPDASEPAQEPASPVNVPGLPPEVAAEVEASLAKGEPSEGDVRQLGELARQVMGPVGVTQLAQRRGVRGADRRRREAEGAAAGRPAQRQAAEAAAGVAGTMWWLTLVDGPLPVGDLIYGALILAAAIAASQAIRRCRCTIRYAPADIMAQCPPRVYGTGVTMHDCQNVAKFTAPQQCRQYYGHCGWMP